MNTGWTETHGAEILSTRPGRLEGIRRQVEDRWYLDKSLIIFKHVFFSEIQLHQSRFGGTTKARQTSSQRSARQAWHWIYCSHQVITAYIPLVDLINYLLRKHHWGVKMLLRKIQEESGSMTITDVFSLSNEKRKFAYWCLAGNEGMIHFITSNFIIPATPIPIHSLRLAPVSLNIFEPSKRWFFPMLLHGFGATCRVPSKFRRRLWSAEGSGGSWRYRSSGTIVQAGAPPSYVCWFINHSNANTGLINPPLEGRGVPSGEFSWLPLNKRPWTIKFWTIKLWIWLTSIRS